MEDTIRQKLRGLPNKPGTYLMKDEHGDVIYVGKAVSLKNRVRSYFQKGASHPTKVALMVTRIRDVEWLVTDTEVEALMLECNLIKQFRPHYNIRLRDDKHYPYLCVTSSEPFPRVFVVRRVKQDGNRYFGPYADSLAVRESLRLIRRLFHIRSCNKPLTGAETDKPCLNLHMGQCDSPCSGRIAREEYGDLVRDTCLFLEGRRTSLVNRLELDMRKAAERLEFERASRLRDQMVAICKLVERQKVISTKDVDQDVLCFTHERGLGCVQTLFVRSGKLIGQEHFFLDGTEGEDPQVVLGEFVKQYYRDATYVPKEVLLSHIPPEVGVLQEWLSVRRGTRVRLICPKIGPKRKIVEMAIQNARLAAEREADAQALKDAASKEDLEELREVLGLPQIPERIEAYDISNIQGKEAVGSMVVVQNGKPANSLYRRFKIRTGDTPDDYAMMREVLLRRLARLDDPKFLRPDLMVIDGGRGQLNAALAALSQAGADIPVVSLAKRMEEIYVPGQEEPILLARTAPSLRLLQRLRDEAHRFALAYHQKLRGKSATKSVLDSIPGIGAARRKALIRRFGSVAGVRRASLEELLAAPGMTRASAEAVYDALHPASG